MEQERLIVLIVMERKCWCVRDATIINSLASVLFAMVARKPNVQNALECAFYQDVAVFVMVQAYQKNLLVLNATEKEKYNQ